jgi:hypothetical protein
VDLETQIDLQEIEEHKMGDENEKKEKENE